MLDVDQADALVRQVRYRNWIIEFQAGRGVLGSALFITLPEVDDNYNPGNVIRVMFIRNLPPLEMLDEAELVRWVFREIMWVERHEAMERFRYKGEMIFNPHTPDGGLKDRDPVLEFRLG